MEAGAFPSDQYAAATQCQHHGLDPDSTIVTVAPRDGERLLRTDDIVERIRATGENLALVLFSGVHYGTGQVFDIETIAAAARATGALVGLDLAHAVGKFKVSTNHFKFEISTIHFHTIANSTDVFQETSVYIYMTGMLILAAGAGTSKCLA